MSCESNPVEDRCIGWIGKRSLLLHYQQLTQRLQVEAPALQLHLLMFGREMLGNLDYCIAGQASKGTEVLETGPSWDHGCHLFALNFLLGAVNLQPVRLVSYWEHLHVINIEKTCVIG